MDYNKLLRRLRQRIFDYDGQQEIKASKLMLKIKDKLGHNDGHSTSINFGYECECGIRKN